MQIYWFRGDNVVSLVGIPFIYAQQSDGSEAAHVLILEVEQDFTLEGSIVRFAVDDELEELEELGEPVEFN